MSFLQKAYSRTEFLDFLKNDFISDFSADIRPVRTHDKSLLKNVQKLGDSKSTSISIYEAVCEDSDHGKRVTITQDAFRVLRDTATRNALVIFYSEKSNNWRLSLLTSTFDLDSKGKVVSKVSNPRRFSYLLGENAKTVTPHKYLVGKGKVADLADLQKRFAVEVVNNDFYKEIATLYDELVGTDEITPQLTYPGHGEATHQFAVRLIGRIIFCWFLREKRSDRGTPLISQDILSGTAAGKDNYYHSVLAPLFFEVLNKREVSREETFREGLYATIPYLNGGLFNPDSDDHYKFDKSLQLSVPGLVDISDSWLRKFFDLLELYNFTVDENTSYDIDLSIDPEMLGRIFENLLARINPETGETVRKLTGSFYTPREIVEYMVDESINQYLKTKTNISDERLAAVISFDLSDDEEFPLSVGEKSSITDALGKLKILDPACGSGAFPIGVLQKIVFILQQVDPDSKHWLERQLKGASPEFRHHLEKEFRYKNFDYLRKLGVIRESIYGVDIQPIATEISRLRCFLTLIVDQSVNDGDANRGIEPLPNLDFKFVTANSLIKLSTDEKSETQTGLFEDASGIGELRELRNEYFGSHNHERDSLKLRFSDRQNQMLQDMIASRSSGFSDITQKLSTWKPFSHKLTNWFDPNWMFGINTFDIVIANPPYVNTEQISTTDKVYFKNNYQTYYKRYDLYGLFIELSLRSLVHDGYVTYIVPSQVFNNLSFKKLREMILGEQHLVQAFYLGDKVFDSANNDVCVLFLSSAANDSIKLVNALKFENRVTTIVKNDYFEKFNNNISIDGNANFASIYDKIFSTEFKKISDLFHVFQGIVTGNNDAFMPDKDTIRKYNLEREIIHKVLHGRDFERWKLRNNDREIIYLDSKMDVEKFPNTKKWLESFKDKLEVRREVINGVIPWYSLQWPRDQELLDTVPKIVIQATRNQRLKTRLVATIDDQGHYGTQGLNFIVARSKSNDELLYLLGILNSSLLNFLYATKFLNVAIKAEYLKNTPIPEYKNTTITENIVRTVSNMLNKNSDSSSELSEQQSDLNRLVFEIYGLDEEEIRTIEESTK